MLNNQQIQYSNGFVCISHTNIIYVNNVCIHDFKAIIIPITKGTLPTYTSNSKLIIFYSIWYYVFLNNFRFGIRVNLTYVYFVS